MKTSLLLVFFAVLFFTVSLVYDHGDIFAEESQDNFHQGTIEWVDKCFREGGGTSIVRVTDYDMNKDSEEIEHFAIKIWSDSDRLEKNWIITETGNDTGVFEGTVFFYTHDEQSAHRVRAFSGDTAYARYVEDSNDVTTTDAIQRNSEKSVIAEIPILDHLPRDNTSYTIEYGPCTISYVQTVKKTHSPQLEMFYPAPLKQIKSGLIVDEVMCKESLILIFKHSKIPVCVKPDSIPKLIERGWMAIPQNPSS